MNEIAKVNSKKTTAKKGVLIPKAEKPDLSSTKNSPVDQMLHLQQTSGNQALQGLFKSGILQSKLKIGEPGDKYELEADRMAEEVMRMPDSVCPTCMEEEKEEVVNREVIQRESLPSEESSFVQRQVGEEERKKREEEEIIQPKLISSHTTPLVQRQVEDTERKKREEEELVQPKRLSNSIEPVVQRQFEEEEEEEEEILQTKGESSSTAEVTSDIESGINSLKASGQPLSGSLRNYFEPRFGYDFSGVRVHTGSKAAETASSINARAFTLGNDVVFSASNYSPETGEGKKLLAHELTHVVQQREKFSTLFVQRTPADEVTRKTIIPSYADKLSDEDLLACISSLKEQLKTLVPESAEYESARSNLAIIETEAASRNLVSSSKPSSKSVIKIPTTLTYNLIEPEEQSFGGEAALGRSSAIGGARGLGYLLSPPIRGLGDPFLPLFMRLRGGQGPLGSLSGGLYGAERYTSSRFLRDLRPRYLTESGKLALMEMTGTSEWLLRYGIRGRDLEQIPSLIARMSQGGIEALAPAEQALIRSFFRAHAESGIIFSSPAMSATTRSGLASMEGMAPFLRSRSYIVRIQIPSSTVGEVNAVLGMSRPSHLVQELEVLITADARGNVTNIRPNPTSSLGRAAPYLRWLGRGAVVVGGGITYYRISTASKEELPRVIGEETGGWAGGFAGAGLATTGCIIFGIATEGIGLIICGLVGAVGGGIGGSAAGGELGARMPSFVEKHIITPGAQALKEVERSWLNEMFRVPWF
jgi:hypothetical protein